MDPMGSKISADYLHAMIREGESRRLKCLLEEIHFDYENSSFEYLQRHCRNAADLENFLKEYPYLFLIENGRVARYSEKLESGQEKANEYFELKLKEYNGPVNILKFERHIDAAPADIRNFMRSFHPESHFKRFLRNRPHLFITRNDNTVHLVEREAVDYFQRALLVYGDGILFMSLRGRIGRAPKHIMNYINNQYPDTEFLSFLEDNKDVFEVNCSGHVYLAR